MCGEEERLSRRSWVSQKNRNYLQHRRVLTENGEEAAGAIRGGMPKREREEEKRGEKKKRAKGSVVDGILKIAD